MNFFDAAIIHFLNRFSQKSWCLDTVIAGLVGAALLKGVVIVAIFWWAWFRVSETKRRDRELILSAIVVSAAALFVARTLAVLLPFRARPIHNAALHFRVPFGTDTSGLIGWSSFPSDHAVLFFAMATSIFFVSRRAGIAVYCYVLFVICLPRVYLGVHYPSDVLVGAMLGIGMASLALNDRFRTFLTRAPLAWLDRSPAGFYACFYVVTFMLGTNFDSLRVVMMMAFSVGRGVIHHRL